MSATFKGGWGAIDDRIQKALNPIALQVAKDSNRYVKKDTGATEGSVWSASDFQSGRIIWDTEYAHWAYYIKSALREKNPLATSQWFVTAKTRHLNEWLSFAEDKIQEVL